ncbi:hypothetical protein SPRG_22203, partial [Saprolegnia parasitica CBS 223.65]
KNGAKRAEIAPTRMVAPALERGSTMRLHAGSTKLPSSPVKPHANAARMDKLQSKAVTWAAEVPYVHLESIGACSRSRIHSMHDRLDSDVRVIAHLLKDVLAVLSSQALLYVANECTLLKLNDSDVLHYQDDLVTPES